MSLPNSLDDTTPAGSESPDLLDNRIRAFKTFVRDVLGIPNATNISAALASFAAAGMQYLIFQNAAAAAAATGRLQRNGTVLSYHDGNGARQVGVVLNKSAAEVTVSNTVTETSIYSFAVPANTINAATAATDGMLRATVLARATNTSGGDVNLTVRAKLGASTFGTEVVSIVNGSSNAPVQIQAYVFPDGASDNLRGHLSVLRNAASGSDQGTAGTNAAQQTLDVTVEWASAAGTITLVKSTAVLEWSP